MPHYGASPAFRPALQFLRLPKLLRFNTLHLSTAFWEDVQLELQLPATSCLFYYKCQII